MTDESVMRKIENHIGAIADLLGIAPTESNRDTPHRVAKMYCTELFSNLNAPIKELDYKMKLFDAPEGAGRVEINDIPFHSVCEHHWLPFFGTCNISYVPDKKVLGLSKFPRVVDFYSRKPQLQERLTQEIGDYLCAILHPKELEITMTAKHTCVMCRGIESNCETHTEFSYLNPLFA